MFDIKFMEQIYTLNLRRTMLYCVQALKFLNIEIPDYEDYADANHRKYDYSFPLKRTNLIRAAIDILTHNSIDRLRNFNIHFEKWVKGHHIRVGMKIEKWLINLCLKIFPPLKYLSQGIAYDLLLSWKQLADMPDFMTGQVPKMAQQIYDSKSFDVIPIMADVCEDEGCTDPFFLNILRHEEMFRGHWLLDLILGIGYKEQYRYPETIKLEGIK